MIAAIANIWYVRKMPVITSTQLLTTLPKNTRLLGIDYGSTVIGLAISDPGLMIATPWQNLPHKKFTTSAEAIFAMIDAENIGGLVLGLPLNMDGTSNPQAQSTRQFAHNLLKKRDLLLCFQDERYSTQAVERMLLDADLSRARRGELVDKLAASYMLQGFLDTMRSGQTPSHSTPDRLP